MTQTDIHDRIEITPEAFFQALLILPHNPFDFTIAMRHSCHRLPWANDGEEVDQAYRQACAEHNIAPYSVVNYASSRGNWEPALSALETLESPHNDMSRAELSLAIASGKSFYQHQFKQDERDRPTSFGVLRDRFMPMLHERGYQVFSATLTMDDARSRRNDVSIHYNMPYHPSEKTNARLLIFQDIPSERGSDTECWFRAIPTVT